MITVMIASVTLNAQINFPEQIGNSDWAVSQTAEKEDIQMLSNYEHGINLKSVSNDRDSIISRISLLFILVQDEILCCSESRCDYVHLEPVAVHQAEESTICQRNRPPIVPSNRRLHRCGSCVEMLMHCEWGHEFVWQFDFYKGSLFFEMYCGKYNPIDETPSELWRY